MVRYIPSVEAEFPQFTTEHGSGSVGVGAYGTTLVHINFTNHYKGGIGDAMTLLLGTTNIFKYDAIFQAWYMIAGPIITGMYILVKNAVGAPQTVAYRWCFLGEKV